MLVFAMMSLLFFRRKASLLKCSYSRVKCVTWKKSFRKWILHPSPILAVNVCHKILHDMTGVEHSCSHLSHSRWRGRDCCMFYHQFTHRVFCLTLSEQDTLLQTLCLWEVVWFAFLSPPFLHPWIWPFSHPASSSELILCSRVAHKF